MVNMHDCVDSCGLKAEKINLHFSVSVLLFVFSFELKR